MLNRRTMLLGLVAVCVTVLPALADELSGTIKSINASGNSFVVASGAKDVEVKVDSSTSYENAKGKTIKKFSLERLNTGGTVDVTHDKGLASKVVLKKGAIKKKDAK